MKLWPVATIDWRNTATSKKIDDNNVLVNYDVTSEKRPSSFFWSVADLIWKCDPEWMNYDFNILISSNFLSYKNWKQQKKSLIQFSYYFFE